MNKQKKIDENYISRTFRLARRGAGTVSPNPMVGAVLVKNGKVISEGFHRHYGEAHAEIQAIESARTSIKGATLYVNLEPCTSFEGKKTPPCADRLIEEKIKRVVIANIDPNPQVNGKSIEWMKRKGIEVITGIREETGRELNKFFFHFTRTGRPYILVKIAQTLDGRIATKEGNSRWISNEQNRKYVHQLRTKYDAVLVGIGTILSDNPHLTVRMVRGANPWRVIVDTHLRTPPDANLVLDDNRIKTIIATTPKGDRQKAEQFKKLGIHVWELDEDRNGKVDLKKLLFRLGAFRITSVIVEGGAGIYTSLLYHKLVDELMITIAPKIIGAGIDAIGDLEVRSIAEAIEMENVRFKKSNNDVTLFGKPKYKS